MRRPFLLPALSLALSASLLAGCSGGKEAWEDSRYATMMQAGDSVFKLGYIKQARQQYATALDRAFLSNDPQAIHDAGFNLATSELRLKAYDDCLATLRKVSDALTVRGWTDARQADLHLVRSSALYERQQWQASEEEARIAKTSEDGSVSLEAYGMIGLDAAELSDRAVLDDAINHLSKSKAEEDQANLRELLVRRLMMDQQWQQAADEARSLAQVREEETNYEAMRRALLLEARALRAAGQIQAADNVLRQVADSQKMQAKEQ
ncbi:hypothetical protein NQF86_03430 [Bombella sp. TMW 2.2543]|uniref:Tetratricopeptide repeat protein n=1 Tax=Bombella pluederhausensis TaxID=2967336 RepID=A0ABT3WF41_9PROT|nr:hypothetical protein [Bombella pluederhausensis]MCX5617725.1 hypothetical protein [Bombella pluederhausensis]